MTRYLLLTLLLGTSVFAHGQTLNTITGAAKPVVDYAIKVELDAEAKRLAGTQTLLYTNHSPDSIPDLQFHLYLNAFKNELSTFWRESGGRLRDDEAPDDGWGYINVTALRIDGESALDAMAFIQPDGVDPQDQTVARVPLKTPLAPGSTVTVEFEFEAQLPKVFARTGYRGNYFLVGQWFPKIGVWESAGDRNAATAGWNCHQFHANSEFYADFGHYKVEITVPPNYVVGATGVGEANDVPGFYTFEQHNVIDFAWTASPDFMKEERLFKADEWVTGEELAEAASLHGISVEKVRLRDVRMILLIQPEHLHMSDRYFKALANAIKYFGLWYGPYPYETLTLVDPPWGAGGSAGMEYPTFITGGTRRWAPEDATGAIPFSLGGPEGVTVHEFGHQYWQSMVATNEFEESWLDEGFNTYSTGLIMDKVYGASPFYSAVNQIPIPTGNWMGLAPGTERETARLGPMMDRGTDRILREAWRFRDDFSYGVNSYPKTQAVLLQLQRELGDDVMARAMRTYFQRWQYRHPATSDFIDVVNDVSGRDMQWFFDRLVLSPGFIDYAVSEASSEEMGGELGIFDEPDPTESPAEDASTNDREGDGEGEDPGEKTLHRTIVVVHNNGNIPYPVDIDVVFTDGEVIREHWEGDYPWVRYRYERPAELDRVVIDPDGRILLDVNTINNSYIAEPDYAPMVKWILKLMLSVQHSLETLAGGLL